MKNAIFVVGAILLISCNGSNKTKEPQISLENSKTVKINLINNLGEIELSLPLRYDTNFSWIHYSDCGKPCEKKKYRYQPKGYLILKETGWMWREPTDSVENFTISHTMDFSAQNEDTSRDISKHAYLKAKILSDPQNPPLLFDTLQKINNRYFSIFAMEKLDGIERKILLAITTVHTNAIEFEYKLITKRTDSISKNYIENSLKLIKTIKINTLP